MKTIRLLVGASVALYAIWAMAHQAFGFSRAPSIPAPVASVSPAPAVSPLPSASSAPLTSGKQGKIEFKPVDFYTTPAERIKIASAAKKLNEVIQSDCFKEFMSKRKLIQTHGLTPEQVALTLQRTSGTVPVKFYYARFSSAVAYRTPPSQEININRKFFGPSSPDCELAATFAHESLGHSLNGFDHDYNWNLARSFSVPYSMGGADKSQGGDAFAKCCK